MPDMPEHHAMHMSMQATWFWRRSKTTSSSGTSLEPISTPVPMMMSMHRGWMLMLHGEAFRQ